MRAIQNFLPNPDHTEVFRIFVNAAPEIALKAARHFDMSHIPWIKLLFDIRTLPDKIFGKDKSAKESGLGVDQIIAGDSGFMLLHETPGREVVVGSIGQFWRLKIPFLKILPGDFKDFNTIGFGKIAWAITVEPFGEGSTIAMELRTTATDEKSRKKLSRYYQLIGIGSKFIRKSVLSHLEAELGKMDLTIEDNRRLHGDDLIQDAEYMINHHRIIEAPVSLVWAYLMQLGSDRSGWFTTEIFEKEGVTIDYLVKGWETRIVGEKFSATSQGDTFFNVRAIESDRHFVFEGSNEHEQEPFKMTWAFILEPIGEDATLLISRARMDSFSKWKKWLLERISYPFVHGMISLTQLDSITRYAERDAKSRRADHFAGVESLFGNSYKVNFPKPWFLNGSVA